MYYNNSDYNSLMELKSYFLAIAFVFINKINMNEMRTLAF